MVNQYKMNFLKRNEKEDIFECPRCRSHKSVPIDCDNPFCECDFEMLKANYKPNIKVFWMVESRTEGDFYEDDNGHEFQSSPKVSRRIEIQDRHTSEIKDIFEEEDGDWDFSQVVHLITDTKGKILFNPKVKVATYTDNWGLYEKWNDEKDPYRKALYSEQLIKSLQERQKYYGLERDRKQERFIEWCEYQRNEEGDKK